MFVIGFKLLEVLYEYSRDCSKIKQWTLLLPVDGAGGMYPYGSSQGDYEMTCSRRARQCRTNLMKITSFKVFNVLLDKISVSFLLSNESQQ